MNSTRKVYEYRKDGRKVATGTLKELAEKTGKTANYFNALYYTPTTHRQLILVGYLMPLYDLYDAKTGFVTFTGNKKECAEHLGLTVGSFETAMSDMKYGRRTGRCKALLIKNAGYRVEYLDDPKAQEPGNLRKRLKPVGDGRLNTIAVDVARMDVNELYNQLPLKYRRLAASMDSYKYLMEFIDKVEQSLPQIGEHK